jgi:hypothetical protein
MNSSEPFNNSTKAVYMSFVPGMISNHTAACGTPNMTVIANKDP